ncbi:hypothetical protein ACQQ2N_11960 [Dokdonella sp. MW10]|uniref:hypothetical protein n=1 Tax=Dokdonella sp. MW10 TaxID=2992926 RepID=UPI003F809F7E
MRRALFGVVMLLGTFVLLAWAAGLQPSSPFSPEQRMSLPGSGFRVVMGAGAEDDDRLRIGAVGEDRTALQSVVLNGIEADEYRLLRYRFEQFPHTLELSVVFRRADALDDVHVVSLPWPGDGEAAFDLGTVPEWQGRIVELGFAEYPTPQVVPPLQGFKPFTLVEAALASRSWTGSFAALWTDWLGNWPWSQRSVHALGRDTDTPRAQSLVLCIVLWIVMLVVAAAAILRVRGRVLASVTASAIVAGWLVLDLQWHAGLRWRHEATRTLFADYAWPERERHAADTEILEAARTLGTALRNEPASTHVIVHSASSFALLRMIYHVLPMNVAVLAQAMQSGVPLPAGTIIVVYDDDTWRYDAATRALTDGGSLYPGDLVLQRGGLLVVRYRGVP